MRPSSAKATDLQLLEPMSTAKRLICHVPPAVPGEVMLSGYAARVLEYFSTETHFDRRKHRRPRFARFLVPSSELPDRKLSDCHRELGLGSGRRQPPLAWTLDLRNILS